MPEPTKTASAAGTVGTTTAAGGGVAFLVSTGWPIVSDPVVATAIVALGGALVAAVVAWARTRMEGGQDTILLRFLASLGVLCLVFWTTGCAFSLYEDDRRKIGWAMGGESFCTGVAVDGIRAVIGWGTYACFGEGGTLEGAHENVEDAAEDVVGDP